MQAAKVLFALFGAAAAAPAAMNTTCKDPALRQEWRQLPEATRQSHLAAVKCLKTKPSRLSLTTPLYDDVPYVQARLDTEIHFVASFLPWHRYFVHLYEEALQSCGYDGVATYWDWLLDVATVSASSIWDAKSGFGGNGIVPGPNDTDADRCIGDGPFKDFSVEYLQLSINKHCLRRNWNSGGEDVGSMWAESYTPAIVAAGQEHVNFTSYSVTLEGGPHGAIHSAIGGDMSPSTLPNDPIFFLHHGQIDRLWTLWQAADPARVMEFGGDKTQNPWDGTVPERASLEDTMRMIGLAEDVKVKDRMSTQSGKLCYRY